ncbi:DUF5959 family protein [Streptomyces rhizosphaerihabitans]|uniref:DUF5959 family protein n=1 Tax=Streptomyces rhizosphaerihabitans TaxID=1266770 RepID=UPI0021C1A806|nr:DUF5959 family protein [Streptomyces rhizosphaerihabitans]MCT9010501.1 DUF5959 family protein [Streptomyces rhizosphaerihabitans]
MAEGSKVDLIRLADGESSLWVQVLGRHMPGVLPEHDFLDAEIVVTSGFAQGRLDVCLAPDDLDNWAQVLGTLTAGRDAAWMDDERSPAIRFELSGQNDAAVVVVEDMAGSRTSVRFRVRLPDGWAHDHSERLRQVRSAWPQQVVETSLGAYEWRR